jgi:hypothetical protein
MATLLPHQRSLFVIRHSNIRHSTLMPFDPTKPANNSPNSSAEMRSQLTSLNADIQQRATFNDLNNAIANALAQTSNNSNGVSTLGQSADGSYQQWQMQMLFDKLDELINALRR